MPSFFDSPSTNKSNIFMKHAGIIIGIILVSFAVLYISRRIYQYCTNYSLKNTPEAEIEGGKLKSAIPVPIDATRVVVFEKGYDSV